MRVFGEQKHPKPNQMLSKLSTKEYFEREKEKEKNNLPVKNQVCFSLDLRKFSNIN